MKRIVLGLLCTGAALLYVPAHVFAALQWQQIGPNGGDLFAIERSPADPDTLFALSFLSVFRSTDAAQTWQPIHNGDMGPGLIAFAFDPLNATRLFLGSGTKGVWRSDDLGETWTNCSAGLPAHPDLADSYYPVSSLAATADGSLFAGIRQLEDYPDPPAWIYRSDDGCAGWVADDTGISFSAQQLTQDIAALLSVDVADNLRAMIYGAGVHHYQGGVWVSANGDLPFEALQATYLAPDPTDGNHLLLGTEKDWIYETLDGGQIWSALALPDALVGLATLPLVYNIAIDPNNTDFLYVFAIDASVSNETPLFSADPLSQTSGIGGYLSGSGGADWIPSAERLPRVAIDPSETVSTDFTPYGEMLRSRVWYATSFGTDNLRKTDDGALTFETANAGITSVLVNSVALHPSPPPPHLQMLFAAAEEGLSLRTDELPDWDFQESAENIIYTWSFAFDPLDSSAVYYGTGHPARAFTGERGIYRADLDCFGEGCPLATQILDDIGVWRVITTPLQPATIYAATQEEGVLVSDDQGLSWAAMNDGLTLPQSITDLALDENGVPLLAAARTNNGNFDADPPQHWLPFAEEMGGVYRFDGGQWVAVPDFTAAVYDLEPHPADAQAFLAATAQGIYETVDGGQSWQAIYSSTLVNDIVVDPREPHYMYAATYQGVLRSTDGGVQWHDLSDGLWQKPVLSLVFDDPTGTLFAGTLGGSVFQLAPDPNPQPALGMEPADLAFAVTPVGFSDNATVTISNKGEADLTITDIVPADPAFSIVDFTLPATLTPGGQIGLHVRFSPQAVGLVNSALTIHSNDPNVPAFAYPVSGEGRAAVPPAPDVKLDGGDGPLTVASGGTVNIDLYLSVGDYLGEETDFWLRWSRGDGTTLWMVDGTGWVESASPVPVLSGPLWETSGPIISFGQAVVTSGAHEIYFAIDDNADGVLDGTWSDAASLTVEQAPPVLFTSPASLDFGQTAVGLSKTMGFAVANVGEADLVITAVDMGSADFALVDPPTFPLTVVPGTPVALKVRFSPQALGPVNSVLTVHSNDPASPAFAYPVSGEGIEPTPPAPNVTVNGLDGPVFITQGENLPVAISLSPGSYLGENADWWILRMTYNSTSGSWTPNPVAIFQSPLFNLSPVTIMNTSSLPTGLHAFYYGVDLVPNGSFDAAQMYSDIAVVMVQ